MFDINDPKKKYKDDSSLITDQASGDAEASYYDVLSRSVDEYPDLFEAWISGVIENESDLVDEYIRRKKAEHAAKNAGLDQKGKNLRDYVERFKSIDDLSFKLGQLKVLAAPENVGGYEQPYTSRAILNEILDDDAKRGRVYTDEELKQISETNRYINVAEAFISGKRDAAERSPLVEAAINTGESVLDVFKSAAEFFLPGYESKYEALARGMSNTNEQIANLRSELAKLENYDIAQQGGVSGGGVIGGNMTPFQRGLLGGTKQSIVDRLQALEAQKKDYENQLAELQRELAYRGGVREGFKEQRGSIGAFLIEDVPSAIGQALPMAIPFAGPLARASTLARAAAGAGAVGGVTQMSYEDLLKQGLAAGLDPDEARRRALVGSGIQLGTEAASSVLPGMGVLGRAMATGGAAKRALAAGTQESIEEATASLAQSGYDIGAGYAEAVGGPQTAGEALQEAAREGAAGGIAGAILGPLMRRRADSEMPAPPRLRVEPTLREARESMREAASIEASDVGEIGDIGEAVARDVDVEPLGETARTPDQTQAQLGQQVVAQTPSTDPSVEQPTEQVSTVPDAEAGRVDGQQAKDRGSDPLVYDPNAAIFESIIRAQNPLRSFKYRVSRKEIPGDESSIERLARFAVRSLDTPNRDKASFALSGFVRSISSDYKNIDEKSAVAFYTGAADVKDKSAVENNIKAFAKKNNLTTEEAARKLVVISSLKDVDGIRTDDALRSIENSFSSDTIDKVVPSKARGKLGDTIDDNAVESIRSSYSLKLRPRVSGEAGGSGVNPVVALRISDNKNVYNRNRWVEYITANKDNNSNSYLVAYKGDPLREVLAAEITKALSENNPHAVESRITKQAAEMFKKKFKSNRISPESLFNIVYTESKSRTSRGAMISETNKALDDYKTSYSALQNFVTRSRLRDTKEKYKKAKELTTNLFDSYSRIREASSVAMIGLNFARSFINNVDRFINSKEFNEANLKRKLRWDHRKLLDEILSETNKNSIAKEIDNYYNSIAPFLTRYSPKRDIKEFFRSLKGADFDEEFKNYASTIQNSWNVLAKVFEVVNAIKPVSGEYFDFVTDSSDKILKRLKKDQPTTDDGPQQGGGEQKPPGGQDKGPPDKSPTDEGQADKGASAQQASEQGASKEQEATKDAKKGQAKPEAQMSPYMKSLVAKAEQADVETLMEKATKAEEQAGVKALRDAENVIREVEFTEERAKISSRRLAKGEQSQQKGGVSFTDITKATSSGPPVRIGVVRRSKPADSEEAASADKKTGALGKYVKPPRNLSMINRLRAGVLKVLTAKGALPKEAFEFFDSLRGVIFERMAYIMNTSRQIAEVVKETEDMFAGAKVLGFIDSYRFLRFDEDHDPYKKKEFAGAVLEQTQKVDPFLYREILAKKSPVKDVIGEEKFSELVRNLDKLVALDFHQSYEISKMLSAELYEASKSSSNEGDLEAAARTKMISANVRRLIDKISNTAGNYIHRSYIIHSIKEHLGTRKARKYALNFLKKAAIDGTRERLIYNQAKSYIIENWLMVPSEEHMKIVLGILTDKKLAKAEIVNLASTPQDPPILIYPKKEYSKLNGLSMFWLGKSIRAKEIDLPNAVRELSKVRASIEKAHNADDINSIADSLIRELLGLSEASNTMSKIIRMSITSSDTTAIVERNYIPEPLRELLGEITDPLVNITMSAVAQARVSATMAFSNAVHNSFKNVLWADASDRGKVSGLTGEPFDYELSGHEYGPLDGKFVTKSLFDAMAGIKMTVGTVPTIADAINLNAPLYVLFQATSKMWRGVSAVSRVAKSVMLAFSLVLYAFNTIGTVFTYIANGNFNLKFFAKNSFKEIKKLVHIASAIEGKRDFTSEELSIIGRNFLDSAQVGDITKGQFETISGQIKNLMEGKIGLPVDRNPFSKLLRYLMNIYSACDLHVKITNFGAEYAKLKKYWDAERAGGERANVPTDDQIMEEAARIARACNFSYSRAIPLVRSVEPLSFFATYISETFRSLFNNVLTAVDMLREAKFNAKTEQGRRIMYTEATKRFAGVAVAAGMSNYIINEVYNTISDWVVGDSLESALADGVEAGDKEEYELDVVRKSLDKHVRKSPMTVLEKRPGGEYVVFMIDRVNPYEPVSSLLRAFGELLETSDPSDLASVVSDYVIGNPVIASLLGFSETIIDSEKSYVKRPEFSRFSRNYPLVHNQIVQYVANKYGISPSITSQFLDLTLNFTPKILLNNAVDFIGDKLAAETAPITTPTMAAAQQGEGYEKSIAHTIMRALGGTTMIVSPDKFVTRTSGEIKDIRRKFSSDVLNVAMAGMNQETEAYIQRRYIDASSEIIERIALLRELYDAYYMDNNARSGEFVNIMTQRTGLPKYLASAIASRNDEKIRGAVAELLLSYRSVKEYFSNKVQADPMYTNNPEAAKKFQEKFLYPVATTLNKIKMTELNSMRK